MTILRRFTLAATVAVTALALVATPAIAATAMPSAAQAASVTMRGAVAPGEASVSAGSPAAAASCAITNAELVVNGSNYNWWWCKWVSGTAITAGYGPFQAMTPAIGFDRRVWFHQDANGDGWADCFFSGGRGISWPLSGRDQNPGNIQVTTNHSPCPS